MNGLSTYKANVSVGGALVSLASGLGFLSQSSASSVHSLSTTGTPLMESYPTLSELDRTPDLTGMSDSSRRLTYTQQQLGCAERLGIDPSECNKEGDLITHKKSIQKRSSTKEQEDCAERLSVLIEECNDHGVFVNRTLQVKNTLLNILPTDSWDKVTPAMLSCIQTVNLAHQNIDSLKVEDFDGFKIKRLDLSDNNLRTLPTERMRNFVHLWRVDLYDNPLIVPEAFLKYFMNVYYQHNIQLYYKMASDYQDTVAIEVGNSSVLVSDVARFFFTTSSENKEGFSPGREVFSVLSPRELSLIQREFVCQYISEAKRCFTFNNFKYCDTVFEFAQQIYKDCEDDSSVSPTEFTSSTQEGKLATQEGKFATQESEPVNLDMKDDDFVVFVAGAVVSVVILLGIITGGIGLGVCLKKRHDKAKVQLKESAIKSVVSTEGLSLDEIVRHVESGKLEYKYVVGLKNETTGITLLHNIGKNKPELLCEWVSEGSLNVETDLGNKNDEQLDSFGNSVLHVIARNHPNVINAWVRYNKVSIEALEGIKNDKNQSVMFYIEHVDPEMYQSWKDDGILNQVDQSLLIRS